MSPKQIIAGAFSKAGEASKLLIAMWTLSALVIGGIVGGVKFSWTVKDYLEEQERFRTDTTGRLDQLELGMLIVAAPQVVDYSPATRVATECAAGEVCTLVARFRRHPGAEACRIIPGRTRFIATSYSDFVERTVVRADQPTGRNIGGDFETIELPLRMPTRIPEGEGDLRIETHYTDCPWQQDGHPPVIQVSPAIPMTIVDN